MDAHCRDTGVCSYMSMLGFVFETPVCLVDECLEGNELPGAWQLELYR